VWSCCVQVDVREERVVKMMLRGNKWVEVKDIIYMRIKKHWRYGCRLTWIRIRSY
jgi:hypothetical protein